MKRFTIGYILFACAMLFATACNTPKEDSLAVALSELDAAISLRENYTQLKERRIALKRAALGSENISYEERLSIIESLVDEYTKYQLDSTLVWLDRATEVATTAGDSRRMRSFKLRTLELYSTAGFYGDAAAILHSIDTLRMSPAEKRQYYRAAHTYHRERREYSADAQTQARSKQREEYYIDRLIATESDTLAKHKLLCTKYSNTYDWEGMSRELEVIMPTLSPVEQEFALYSYLKALSVGDNRGSTEEFMIHLARSARADMLSLTNDHASLCMLSEILFHTGDIKRAFEYIQIAMEDATFYNSRLRPWQVATLLPVIENSYSKEMESQRKDLFIAIIVISLLWVALVGLLIAKSRQNRQIEQAKTQLEEMNAKLSEYVARLSEQNKIEHSLAAKLSEANAVKEQYIGLFLVISSNYIDLLKSYHNNVRKRLSQGAIDTLQKEIGSSTIIEDAEEEFYANFDNAFLSLYPTFVEEFNALLKEDQQIVLKNPRRLNTKLRIFALIKLGITDSSRIASLLRYSVNTIYNYRAGVKNKAIVERDNFEDDVRKIG